MTDTTFTVSRRVLVVDDNQPSALTLSWALELQGCEVKTCFDGKSAVAIAHEFHPDIVFLDIGMPGMDGFEVCRQLRADFTLSGVRVVAQTGWGDADTRRRATEAGFDHHMTKPVDFDRLVDLLRMAPAPQI
jgi:CheY-like chemotaxis protein